jgi:3'-5' exoribonuclease
MQIKDVKVGESYKLTVVVSSSTIRTTKTNKQYLDLEVFDGIESINGKIWDWTHTNSIERNAILDIEGTITEYMGVKQLAISLYTRNTSTLLTSFAPTCPYDVDEYLQMGRDLIAMIDNKDLHDLTLKVYIDHTKMLMSVPGAKKIHHAYVGGALVHLVDTTKKAIAIASTIPEAHLGLCIAGAILHDIGKLYTYTIDGATVEFTDEGESLDHIALGLICMNDYKNVDNINIVGLLQHIIASHHGLKEYGSPVTPGFLEAWIVNYADGIDAKAATIRLLNAKATGNYTEKEWTLENKKMVTYKHIKELLGE